MIAYDGTGRASLVRRRMRARSLIACRRFFFLMLLFAALTGRFSQAKASDGDEEPPGGDNVVQPAAGEIGRAALRAREDKLVTLSSGAWRLARRRARELYRLMRLRDAEESSRDAVAPAPAGEEPAKERASAVTFGLIALARDLQEARSLSNELMRVSAEREAPIIGASDEGAVGASHGATARVPEWEAPVGGRLARRFGLARDTSSGLWLGQTGLGYESHAGETVHAPVDGKVRDVRQEDDGQNAVILQTDGAWIAIITGLGRATAKRGDAITRGQDVGLAAAGLVGFELWHDGRPRDPRPSHRDHP